MRTVARGATRDAHAHAHRMIQPRIDVPRCPDSVRSESPESRVVGEQFNEKQKVVKYYNV